MLESGDEMVPADQAGAGGQNRQQVTRDDLPPPLAPAAAPLNRAALVAGVVQLSNAERAKMGIPPLQPNENLMKAAQDYAAILAPGPCFEHTCPPVPDVGDRARNAGYAWMRIGENIAAGDFTAEAVVASWMDSPGHRANILNADFKEIGVGVLTGSGEFSIYWAQVFGTR